MCMLRFFIGVILSVVYGSGEVSAANLPPRKKVVITQIVEHPALNSTRQGVEDGLKNAQIDIQYENAQGNLVTAAQIMQGVVSQNPDVIVAISTPSAQAALANTQKIPVVFAAVSNPQEAGLLNEQHRHHVTGSIDLPDIKEQLNYFKSIFPQMKKVGVIYNSGEANSQAFVTALDKIKDKFSLEIIESTVTRTSDVSLSIQKLLGEGVEAIILPQDNTVVSALDVVVSLTQEAKIPLLTSDTDLISRGAFAAIGFSHYETGLTTAHMVSQILSGTSPANIPVLQGGKLERLINGKLMRMWGVKASKHLKVKIVE